MNRVSALAIGSVERVRKPIPRGAIAVVRRIMYELWPATMRTTTGIRNKKAMGAALGAARMAKFEGMVPWCRMMATGVQEEAPIFATTDLHFALREWVDILSPLLLEYRRPPCRPSLGAHS